uniref:Putative secreted protein n=1 Tax=Anopheles marajoara TaxID=58244 RepID=A0A2M4CDA6_9DIPT
MCVVLQTKNRSSFSLALLTSFIHLCSSVPSVVEGKGSRSSDRAIRKFVIQAASLQFHLDRPTPDAMVKRGGYG